MSDEAELIDEAEEFRAYPKSVQPGIPTLGEVPEGWRVLPMGQLLKVVQRPVKMVDDDVYQLVTARRNRGGLVARDRLTGAKIATKTQFRVKVGDFVMSRRQIAHGACGILPPELDGALVSNEYAVLLPTDELDKAFLRHLPHSIYFQQTCFHSSIGVHVEKLVFNLDHWLTWPFLVPAPAEQRRIAAVLDAWDTAIAQAKTLYDSLGKRQRGISLRLLGQSLNEGITLGSIGRFEKGRGLPKTALAEAGIPCLRYAEIYTRYGNTTYALVSRTTEAGARASRELRHGDIVFAASGETAEEIGKAVGYLGTERAVVGSDTVVLTDHGQDPSFLAHVLNSEELVRQKSAAGKGHSVVHIHAPDLAKLVIPLPPLLEQERIARLLQEGQDAIELTGTLATSLRQQKMGLMQRLLTGQLPVPKSIDTLLSPVSELVAAA